MCGQYSHQCRGRLFPHPDAARSLRNPGSTPFVSHPLREPGCRVPILNPLGKVPFSMPINTVVSNKLLTNYAEEPCECAGAKADVGPSGQYEKA